MNLELWPHQVKALDEMHNGCILNGDVGSGKSRTALAYYYLKVLDGKLRINGEGRKTNPKKITPLYIITTAKKRDTNDWESEMAPFLLSTDPDLSICHIKVVVDSWNNIKKYVGVKDSFFIFDEDRVTGKGAWVKAFYKIAKVNEWILLTGSPGDSWSDYIPVFVANGFYKNPTEFNRLHVVFNRYCTFPKIDKYVNTKRLERCKEKILVRMEDQRHTVAHSKTIIAKYDIKKYKSIMKDRWDPYTEEPIENISKLCYLLRRVCNEDSSRIEKVKEIVTKHDRVIIFYNFDYELEILHKIGDELKIPYTEWNGHKHESLLKGKRWLYLCQYTSAAEGWNCITTDTMVFYSLNYSYKTMIQAMGRINRMNTSYTDLYFYLIRSASPIDLAIMQALKKKKKFNERRFVGV